MTDKMKLVLTGVALIVLLGGGSLLYNRLSENYPLQGQNGSVPAQSSEADEETAEEEPKPQEEAPVQEERLKYRDFTLDTLDGRRVSLSDYEGSSAFVLNFWASWCGPCKQEMPHFNKLEGEYRDKGVVFLMVNLTDGQGETKESAEAYLDGEGLSFDNVLLDSEGEASYLYSVTAIPATYVFDRDGYYVRGFRGTITEAQLRTVLEEVAEP